MSWIRARNLTRLACRPQSCSMDMYRRSFFRLIPRFETATDVSEPVGHRITRRTIARVQSADSSPDLATDRLTRRMGPANGRVRRVEGGTPRIAPSHLHLRTHFIRVVR